MSTKNQGRKCTQAANAVTFEEVHRTFLELQANDDADDETEDLQIEAVGYTPLSWAQDKLYHDKRGFHAVDRRDRNPPDVGSGAMPVEQVANEPNHRSLARRDTQPIDDPDDAEPELRIRWYRTALVNLELNSATLQSMVDQCAADPGEGLTALQYALYLCTRRRRELNAHIAQCFEKIARCERFETRFEPMQP